MIKTILFALIITCAIPMTSKADEKNDYLLIKDEVVQSFVTTISKEFNLIYLGGGGELSNGISTLDVIFEAPRRATIAEARALKLYLTQKLADKLNQETRLKPYLKEFPFPLERIFISIAFTDKNSRDYSDGTVAYVNQGKGEIFYYTSDPFAKKLVDLKKETYSEAEKLLKEYPIENLREHRTTEQEKHLDRVFEDFQYEIARDLKLHCSYIGGNLTDGIKEIGVSLIKFSPTSQEEARELQVVITEKLLHSILSKQELQPFLKQSPFTAEHIKVRIDFKNRKHFYFNDGGLEKVEKTGNEITYFSGEVFEEALKRGTFAAGPSISGKETYKEAFETVKKTPPKKRKTKARLEKTL